MLRAIAMLAFALSLLGCGLAPPGENVELLTGARPFDEDECLLRTFASEMLLADPDHGTVLAGFLPDQRTPIMWPEGFTGRRVGSTVSVLDATGNVVATTGRSYVVTGDLLFAVEEPLRSTYRRGVVLSPIETDMFYACGPVRPEPTAHLLDDPWPWSTP